jgi:hypothetical protein
MRAQRPNDGSLAEDAVVTWTCPNCARPCATPFCARCGERPLPPRDLSLRGVAGKAFQAITSIDGKLIRTLSTLLRRPGFLTAAYMDGRRTPYLAPFKLFVVANAVFFGVQSLTGTNVFSSTLESHLHHQDWSELAQALVDAHLRRRHTALDAYAPLFDRSVILYAKSLIIVMVLPFALLLPLVYAGARKPFMTHVAFALHLYAFLLLFFCLPLCIAKAHLLLGGAGLDAPWLDNLLSLINLGACGVYIHLASGPAYGARGLPRVLKAGLLALIAGAIVLGYRFVLLLITLTLT